MQTIHAHDLANLLRSGSIGLQNRLKAMPDQTLSGDDIVALLKECLNDACGEAENKALKAIKKSGVDGMTPRELRKASRTLAAVDACRMSKILHQLQADGKIECKEIVFMSGRKRTAWVAID